jgi:hypothetical protein
MLPLEQQPNATATGPEGRPLPPLVAVVQDDFDQYLEEWRLASRIFSAKSVGLEVVPSSVPKGLITHFNRPTRPQEQEPACASQPGNVFWRLE